MKFRLRAEESVAHELRRLAKKCLRAAKDDLGRTWPPSEEAIHDARKSLKKARAVFQTVQADGGHVDRDGKLIRKVSHLLSPLRDADAVTAIFKKLRNRNRHLFSEHTFARLERELLSRRREVMTSASRRGDWKKAHRQLARLGQHARQWEPAHAEFGALEPGLRRVHHDGRKAMARALKRKGAADFHEWRKSMKALWYQLRLLEAFGPRIRRDVATLHRAETWLGEDHDLVVLCDELSEHAQSCGATIDFDRLRLAADRYQCALRNKAIAGTRSLFERNSGAFVRGIKQAWLARRTASRTGRNRAAA